MSFRQFGGLNYAARNNIVSSSYNTSNNLLVTQNVGQPNSHINFEGDISGNFAISGNLNFSGTLTANTGSFNNLGVKPNSNDIFTITDTSNTLIQLGEMWNGFGSSVSIGFNSAKLNDKNLYTTTIGSSSCRYLTTGLSNTALGLSALKNITTGCNNNAIGYSSLYGINTGYYNIAIGHNSGNNPYDSSANSFIGALTNLSGPNMNYSTALGYNAQITASNQIKLGGLSDTGVYPQVVVPGSFQANNAYTPSYPGAYLITEYTTGSPSITSFIQLPIFSSIPSYFSFYNSYYTGSTYSGTQTLTPNNFNGITTSTTGGGSITYFDESLNINDNNAYYILNPGYQLIFYQNVNFNYGKTSGQTATISNLSGFPVTCNPNVVATSAVELYYWNGSNWILIPAPTTSTG